MIPYQGHFLRMKPFQAKSFTPAHRLAERSDFFSSLLKRAGGGEEICGTPPYLLPTSR